MITIKFAKHSKKSNKLHYSIVVISTQAKPKSGKLIEKIGHYQSTPNKWNHKTIFIDMNRLYFWLSRGVKMNKSLYVLIKPLFLSLN